MGKKWTEKEINFLKENYPNNGGDYCLKKLDRPKSSIYTKANKLGLKLNGTALSIKQSSNGSKNKVKVFNYKNKIDVYILGLLWADGYLHPNKNRLELEINSNDFSDINVLFEEEIWSKYYRSRKGRGSVIRIGNYLNKTCAPLRDMGFSDKSRISVPFINKIPKDLIKYFIRGFFDGDGNFYYNEKLNLKQCSFSGTYNQDWGWLIKILKDLGVDYSVKQKKQNSGKYSIIQIKTKSIFKLGDFMYGDYEKDKIGFKRKWEKYNKIIQK